MVLLSVVVLMATVVFDISVASVEAIATASADAG
jgi:hypothetical protein